jgi:hypothetical protein
MDTAQGVLQSVNQALMEKWFLLIH